jgi:uncharacterized membrane protein
MEFLLFFFGVFTLFVAWRARSIARDARTLATELQREVGALREGLATTPAQFAPHATHAETDAPAVTPQATPPEPDAPVAATVEQEQSHNAVAATGVELEESGAQAASVPLAASTGHGVAPTTAPATSAAAAPPADQPPSPTWTDKAHYWLFGGNFVAKLGLLVLFVGVSFLLKYTAERITVPIELRLAAIVLADIALLAWGWRIRLQRPAISLPVQGTALAVLLLVTFGAFRLYHLIPSGMAFTMLLLLTAFTCILAVLQDAMWLAIFGIAGGFSAPILASSGGGSHIGLFAYYALLNGGVLALSLWRAWQPLNLLGFAFTFAISTMWGVLRYSPDHYLSVQLFLLLFFVFYVSIPLAYARQQAVQLKHYVDGTLVFGTPMLGFGLQFSLVRGMTFGVAFSALVLGLFYIGLATTLRRRPALALLSDAFLALGIVFGTLAIPFALDDRWTSAAWAMEGAGIVWIGLRQRQPMAWMFGLLVQAAAWLSFLAGIAGLSAEKAAASNLWLGFLLLALTGFLMATRFRAQPAHDNRRFPRLAAVFLGLATAWLIAGIWVEILLRTGGATRADLLVISALLTATLLYMIGRRMDWPLARALALAMQGLAGIALLWQILLAASWPALSPSLFDRPVLGAVLICAGALFSSWVLKRHGEAVPDGNGLLLSRLMLLWAALWWFMQVLPELARWLGAFELLPPSSQLESLLSLYGLLVAASAVAGLSLARRLAWAGLRHVALPAWAAFAIATAWLLIMLYIGLSGTHELEWIVYTTLWLTCAWLLHALPAAGWPLGATLLRQIHVLRTVGPWLAIWPWAADWVRYWLLGGTHLATLYSAGWVSDASWARFIPAWLMMAYTGWLMARCRRDGWPVHPLADWYRQRLLPPMCAWSLGLAALWNLTQDGAMAPLPYLPLLNPLDLTTGFAALLGYSCYRQLPQPTRASWSQLPVLAALAAYGWFNLILLRSVSHYMGIAYAFEVMLASQFVQAMLSLVWSVTALILMRLAAQRGARGIWIAGAILLGMVLLKLLLVDLSHIGGIARIISFVGVGALMVGIGYLAPFPPSGQSGEEAA